MKPTSILINPSRGTLVDSNALAKALREHWIWGAGVDVVEGEPNVGTDHPLVKEPRSENSSLSCSTIADYLADASFYPISVVQRQRLVLIWLD